MATAKTLADLRGDVIKAGIAVLAAVHQRQTVYIPARSKLLVRFLDDPVYGKLPQNERREAVGKRITGDAAKARIDIEKHSPVDVSMATLVVLDSNLNTIALYAPHWIRKWARDGYDGELKRAYREACAAKRALKGEDMAADEAEWVSRARSCLSGIKDEPQRIQDAVLQAVEDLVTN